MTNMTATTQPNERGDRDGEIEGAQDPECGLRDLWRDSKTHDVVDARVVGAEGNFRSRPARMEREHGQHVGEEIGRVEKAA